MTLGLHYCMYARSTVLYMYMPTNKKMHNVVNVAHSTDEEEKGVRHYLSTNRCIVRASVRACMYARMRGCNIIM